MFIANTLAYKVNSKLDDKNMTNGNGTYNPRGS
jgi:hypothetical protein